MERWLYSATHLPDYEDETGMERTNDPEEAVLRSSEVKSDTTGIAWLDNQHAPAIDIDMECSLVASSTEGHYHLYIDKAMSWENYEKLLKVMYEVGIVEEGFYNMSVKRGKSMLRVRDKSLDPTPQLEPTTITYTFDEIVVGNLNWQTTEPLPWTPAGDNDEALPF